MPLSGNWRVAPNTNHYPDVSFLFYNKFSLLTAFYESVRIKEHYLWWVMHLYKNKQSGFAWVITHKAQPLWRGVGRAPGHTDDMYSRQAEAFGLLAGLTFLAYYMDCYGHNWFQKSLLQCFCNNLSVTTNVEAMLTPSIPQWNQTNFASSLWAFLLAAHKMPCTSLTTVYFFAITTADAIVCQTASGQHPAPLDASGGTMIPPHLLFLYLAMLLSIGWLFD